MKQVCLSLTALLVSYLNFAQQYNWAIASQAIVAGVDGTRSSCITKDDSGYVYVAGTFEGTVDFDYGPGTAILSTNSYRNCAFIAKYNNEGKYVWAKALQNLTTSAAGYVTGIAVDKASNVFVTGYFIDSIDFDPGLKRKILTTNNPQYNNYNTFLARYDKNGNYGWAEKIGSDAQCITYALAIDAKGNLFITGYFGGTTDFDPGPNSTLRTSIAYDAFISKYNAKGSFVSVLQLTRFEADYLNEINLGTSITTDNNGAIYVTGSFSNHVSFSSDSLHVLYGSHDIFIAKYTNQLQYTWAESINSDSIVTSSIISTGIKVDAQKNVLLTGHFSGAADFDPGSSTLNLVDSGFGSSGFLAKYNKAGKYVWAKNFNPSIVASTSGSYPFGLYVDGSGNSYFTGYYIGDIDFDASKTGVANLTGGNYSAFVCRYDAGGNYNWVFPIKIYNNPTAIACDKNSNVFVTGFFNGYNDFDPGPDTAIITTANADMYIAKYTQAQIALNVLEGSPITQNNEFKISVYPNPAKSFIVIEAGKEALQNAIVQIVDMRGRIVLEQRINYSIQRINISSLPKAIYILKVSSNKTISTQKIVIE